MSTLASKRPARGRANSLMVVQQTQQEIYAPVARHIDLVIEKLAGVWRSQEAVHSGMAGRLAHVLSTPGKRVRPAITLLASKLWGREPDERTINMATAVELLHIATLIHDDTVDGADTRRGRATANSLWGGRMAVLLGDYAFATSAVFVCETNSLRLIKRYAETIAYLSRGELHEMLDAWNASITQREYYARVYDKTASLFSTAAESGAVLGEGDEAGVQACTEYGVNLGIAYQIVDDILDFEHAGDALGKPVNHDLGEGVLTLPSLIALENGWAPKLREYLELDAAERDGLMQEAYSEVRSSGAMADARAAAESYLDKAVDSILATPESEARESLLGLVQYARSRAS